MHESGREYSSASLFGFCWVLFTKNVTINTCYQTWPLSLYQSFFFSEFSINSSILSHNEDYLSLLSWFLVPAVGNVSHWLLCYRSSRDGAVDEYFHKQCDRLNDTITVIRVNNYVFGGYVDIPWGNYFPSFLFGSVRTTNEYTATALQLKATALQLKATLVSVIS